MKCPNCDYVHGWDPEKQESVNGEHGEFYTLSNDVKLTRSRWRFDNEEVTLHGCPNPDCKHVFWENYF